jgi:hypothetical protein
LSAGSPAELRMTEDLIHSKDTKATKTEGFFTEGNEDNEGPAGSTMLGTNNHSFAWLASVRILYFVAFVALL